MKGKQGKAKRATRGLEIVEQSNKLLYTLELFLRMIHTNSTKLLTHTHTLSLWNEGVQLDSSIVIC